MEKQKISFYVPVDVLERVDRIAEKADLDRTKLIVNLLDEGTKTLEACGKVGILQFTLLIRDMSDKLAKWADRINKKEVKLP